MGAFNELIIEGPEPGRVQFKYATCWQLEYRLGDRISWDGIARAETADGIVIIPGIGCRREDDEFRYYAIELDRDVIRSVTAISERAWEDLSRQPREIGHWVSF